jgi:hypothetical protein
MKTRGMVRKGVTILIRFRKAHYLIIFSNGPPKFSSVVSQQAYLSFTNKKYTYAEPRISPFFMSILSWFC